MEAKVGMESLERMFKSERSRGNDVMVDVTVRCILMRRGTTDPIAVIDAKKVPVDLQGDRFVVDYDDDECDIVVGGETLLEAIMAAVDSLQWFGVDTLTEGRKFPSLRGVSFRRVGDDDEEEQERYSASDIECAFVMPGLVPA